MSVSTDDSTPSRSWEELHRDVVHRGRRLRRRRRIVTCIGAVTVVIALTLVVAVVLPREDGRDAVRTVTQPGVVDGDVLAFVRTYDDGLGGSELRVLRADGQPSTLLSTDTSDNDGSPSLSPDGRWIAFQSERDNPLRRVKRVTDIYRMRTDGSDVRRVTVTADPGQGNGVRHPSWSPDGRFIVAAREDEHDDSRIVRMRADGSGMRVISTGAGDVGPVWSPDGRWIAYRSRPPGGEEELWIVHPDGTGARRVVRTVHDSPIAWTPDGRITFSRMIANGTVHLFTVGRDGRSLARLGDRDGVEDLAPAWTADGRTLVYSADPRQQPGAGRAEDGAPVDGHRAGHLVAADARGRVRRVLTEPPPGADDGSPTLGPAR